MLRGNGRLPYATAGLPVEGAIERRKAQIAKQAQDLREKQIQGANQLRQSRRDRFCIDAETELNGPALGAFLNTKRDDLSGMTPLESAQDSESGLTRARNALSDLVRQRVSAAEADAERKRYQEMITADAVRSLPPEHVDTFLNGRDDDLGRITPLLFARDEATYLKALKKLSEWQREFGQPF
ncbi:hypothetical protein [Mesorhizobium sp. M0085]|uniref:hypothetical protein n=1 Tax=Mesorhizobium sp. M0085 TaxID=2956872 RepID=UPI003335EA82